MKTEYQRKERVTQPCTRSPQPLQQWRLEGI